MMRGRWHALLIAVVCALLGVRGATAQSQATNFTLQPGGSATITFVAFCTEFGQVFAENLQVPNGVVSDASRAALAYGINKGYTASSAQALQLQFALWQTLGTTNSPKGDATAQDVLTNGKAVPANPQGTSLLDAAAAKQVKLTLVSWQPNGPKVPITATASDNFYGTGQLKVENASQQALTLFMPVGTIFPSVNPTQQTMTGYATALQVSNPALPATGGSGPDLTLPLAALLVLGALALRLRRDRRSA